MATPGTIHGLYGLHGAYSCLFVVELQRDDDLNNPCVTGCVGIFSCYLFSFLGNTVLLICKAVWPLFFPVPTVTTVTLSLETTVLIGKAPRLAMLGSTHASTEHGGMTRVGISNGTIQ